MELAPLKKDIKPDDQPQNVDISHLSDPTSSTTNLDETYPLDTSCDHLLHLDSPSLSSELQDNQVLIVLKLIFLLNQRENRIIPTFHQQMFSLDNMTMNCSYYKKRLMDQIAISTIRTLIYVKIKMTSSFMPPTLATPLHCPNSWHNTTMKA